MDTHEKIRAGKATIGIVGLGYVGLPLARRSVACGFPTIGLDTDERKIGSIRDGRSYIKHIPDSDVTGMLEGGLEVSSDFAEAMPRCDALLICVPTPLDRMREPDLSFVVGTTREIARRLRRGQLITLESTTYPGTTREVMRPLLDASGLRLERDYFLAYSPEREDPGRTDMTTRDIPKVVGGAGPNSLKLADALYGAVVRRTVPVSSCEVAEACKIVENVYRCVNIALVNELKLLFDRMGIDVWEVIAAAQTKPFGFQAFYPGPGLGGHCIPIDPLYLSWKARQYGRPTRFIELAAEINTSMPEHVVNRVAEALNGQGKPLRGSRVLVLGLAYKPDVDDVRESPAVTLIELLQQRGARVQYHDPYIPSGKPMREHNITHLRSIPLTPANLRRFDCVLIATDHSNVDYDLVCRHARLVVDTRNATGGRKRSAKRVVKA